MAGFGLARFTIISIVRLHTLVKFGYTENPTWTYMEISTWSTVEIAVGMICVCMPSYRLLIMQLFPSHKGASYKGTTNEDSNSPDTHSKLHRKTPSLSLNTLTKIREIQKPLDSAGITLVHTYGVQFDDISIDGDVEDRISLVELKQSGATSKVYNSTAP